MVFWLWLRGWELGCIHTISTWHAGLLSAEGSKQRFGYLKALKQGTGE